MGNSSEWGEYMWDLNAVIRAFEPSFPAQVKQPQTVPQRLEVMKSEALEEMFRLSQTVERIDTLLALIKANPDYVKLLDTMKALGVEK